MPGFQMEAEICSHTHSRSWTRRTHTGTHWSLTCANTHSLRCFLLPLMRFYLQLLDNTASSSLTDVNFKRLHMATSKGYIRVSYFANVRCERSSWDDYVTSTPLNTLVSINEKCVVLLSNKMIKIGIIQPRLVLQTLCIDGWDVTNRWSSNDIVTRSCSVKIRLLKSCFLPDEIQTLGFCWRTMVSKWAVISHHSSSFVWKKKNQFSHWYMKLSLLWDS